MAPIGVAGPADVEAAINSTKVLIFSKTTCPFCAKVKELFKTKGVDVEVVELDQMPGDTGKQIQDKLKEMTGQSTVPNVFINGRHLGGADDTLAADASGKLTTMLAACAGDHGFDFDLIVIGGGSGGLAASKEAARLGKKVAVCDFVTPSPPGTTWGLGGTCVNVGCIPKKLMHHASILGGARKDAVSFGWPEAAAGEAEAGDDGPKSDWGKMVENVQNYIGGLNWGYKVALREKTVKYLNEYAEFTAPNTIKTTNKKGVETVRTSAQFIIATGGRPRYPDIPGAREFGITSDDIFSLPYAPGKTLFVGASYISLECAGFLQGLGFKTTVLVRSILLRGFDQQCAKKIGDYMESEGVTFINECVPTAIEKVEDGQPGKYKVMGEYKDGTKYEDFFNTVCFAVGRDAETNKLGLDKVGVKTNPKNGKIIHDEREHTTADHIYAIGDVLDGKPELTPVAIQAGMLLARRLCNQSDILTDYVNVPTTVFTPLEYGCIGVSEEDAAELCGGEENVEVYHKSFWPLEWTLAKRPENVCYAKLVCDKRNSEKVLGFHYLGPNAGEVTQGYAGMIKMGATKADFDAVIGIHPTTAEVFTTMDITKNSGVDPSAAGC